jgi:UPF0271 protein
MRYAVDASFFFSEATLAGEIFTTPSVVEEIADVRSRCRLEALLATGLSVHPPSLEGMRRASEAAEGTGDITRLSPADTDLLALALDTGATVVSDDYALQNVALSLGLGVSGILRGRGRARRWRFRCPGCNRRYTSAGACPACGSPLKRTLK